MKKSCILRFPTSGLCTGKKAGAFVYRCRRIFPISLLFFFRRFLFFAFSYFFFIYLGAFLRFGLSMGVFHVRASSGQFEDVYLGPFSLYFSVYEKMNCPKRGAILKWFVIVIVTFLYVKFF